MFINLFVPWTGMTNELSQKLVSLETAARRYARAKADLAAGRHDIVHTFTVGDCVVDVMYKFNGTKATPTEVEIYARDTGEPHFAGSYDAFYGELPELRERLPQLIDKIAWGIVLPAGKVLDVTRHELAGLEDTLLETFADILKPAVANSRFTEVYHRFSGLLRKRAPRLYQAILNAKIGYADRHGLPATTWLYDVVSKFWNLSGAPAELEKETSVAKKAASVGASALMVGAAAAAALHTLDYILGDGSDWGAAAEVSWPEGKNASDVAGDFNAALHSVHTVPIDQGNAKVELGDNFVAVSTLGLGRIFVYGVNGSLITSISDAKDLFGADGSNLVYCAKWNGSDATLLKRITLNSLKTSLILDNTCGKVLRFFDDGFVVAAETPAGEMRYLFDNNGSRLLETDARYDPIAQWRDTILFANVSPGQAIGGLATYDFSSRTWKANVPLPQGVNLFRRDSVFVTGLPIKKVKLPLQGYNDNAGNLIFGGSLNNGSSERDLTLLKFDGQLVSRFGVPVSISGGAFDGVFINTQAGKAIVAYDVINSLSVLDMLNGQLVANIDLVYNPLDAKNVPFFEGSNILAMRNNSLIHLDTTTGRSRVIERDLTEFLPLEASTYIIYRACTDEVLVRNGNATMLSNYVGCYGSDGFKLNKNMVAWTEPERLRFGNFKGLDSGLDVLIANFMPTIKFDSRPETQSVAFHNPALPRVVAGQGDDNDVTNNAFNFDRFYNYTGGKEKFKLNGAYPVFTHVADYQDHQVFMYFYYRTENSGYGKFEDSFYHEHDWLVSAVWVNKSTGKPFHFAVRDHAIPLWDSVWQQKDVSNVSELVAAGQWRSGELGFDINPAAPVWRDGRGLVLNRGNTALVDLSAIINNGDVNLNGEYKANGLHGIANITSPPPVAPWLLPEYRNPDSILTKTLSNAYAVLFELGSPADMSLQLDGKVSNTTSREIPRSAVDSHFALIASSLPVEPKVKLVGTANGTFDLRGYLMGQTNGRFANFTLDDIPIKQGEVIEVTPNWNLVANGSASALNVFIDRVNAKPVAFNIKPIITGDEFERAYIEATAKKPNNNKQELPLALILGGLVGGGGAAGLGVYEYGRRKRKQQQFAWPQREQWSPPGPLVYSPQPQAWQQSELRAGWPQLAAQPMTEHQDVPPPEADVQEVEATATRESQEPYTREHLYAIRDWAVHSWEGGQMDKETLDQWLAWIRGQLQDIQNS